MKKKLKHHNMNKTITCLLFALILVISGCQNSGNELEVSSPDGSIKVKVGTDTGQLYYAVEKDGQAVLLPSKLGLRFKNHSALGEKVKITASEHQTFNETWEQPWGEKRLVENRYEGLRISLKENKGEGKSMILHVKVYNDGFGFRYEVPEQTGLDSMIIMDEITEFRLPEVAMAWWTPIYTENYYEGITRYTSVNDIDTVNCPLTLEMPGGKFLAIQEANLTDYAAMNLYCSDSSTLTVDLTPWSTGEKVFAKAPFVSPWRTMIIAEKPGDLVTSYLNLNLNEPCAIDDVSWIEPGRYIGIWWGMHMGKYTWHMGSNHGATTENTLRHIDFAAKHGFSGVLVEGWNIGWENDWTKEGHRFSFTESYPDFDLEKITQYAQKKGVRLIGHHETGGATQNYEAQMEAAFALYQQMGVRCVKTGYVSPLLDGKERHSSQYGIRHFRKVVETAARYQIMIDNHEPAMPTGLRRTYPNLVSGEGVRGQEYNAWSPDGGNKPDHLTIIPFTRGLAGPIDYTPGIFNFDNPVNPNTRVQSTLALQLALYVIIYSPVQMAADLPENYEGHPALRFIEHVPVNWDVTRVLDAIIGDHVTMVRKDRASDDWYLGSITDENSRMVELDLGFLDSNRSYNAEIYRDGDEADYQHNPTSLIIESRTVQSTDLLQYQLARGGGLAIRFSPVAQ
ncbi:MAG: glycoside hydrolase family 97 protein [Prolixibacteraceae bacterium]|nr:glycoside hydrolase family 97 protein [Prolixibacteraceae bacterium]